MSHAQTIQDSLKPIVALCKRRGFIYPGSEIYGGFANTYSFGPYGAELKKNVKDLWWKMFVRSRRDMVGLDGPILLHPRAWLASGHLEGFNDALIDCKACKSRFRCDHLIEEVLGEDADGLTVEEMTNKVRERHVKCPKCGAQDFTEARHFNLMFHTHMSKTGSDGDLAYLRPETAQAIFLDYKNIIDTMRVKIPFGVAQIGKAFRNEITPGNFVFRVIEFEQMEIEYFIRESVWEKVFEEWLQAMHKWCDLIGLKKSRIHEKEHPKEQLSHYSKRTVDLVYDFPFGRSELYGLAYRTDFYLKRHAEYSSTKLEYTDPETREKFVPHVIEPTFGVERTLLALLCDAYEEEQLENGEMRTVLRFAPCIAPVKVAVFPLMKKEPLAQKAEEIFAQLQAIWTCEYDESGAIGKRYRRQDELGTPYCITIDFDTLENDTVTLRDRDSMKQERVAVKDLVSVLSEKLSRENC
ncbi:MAG TPA: glycine--tRNA ligase [Parachlamydiales bacterium]|nr:glycine--tRNA ligase [Parachlamydiales bacterium]